jgi:mRNA interferase MazF
VTIEIAPWSVWWIDFDPVEGREQAGRRPGIVVSSAFQLAVTGRGLICVLPMTTRQRTGWAHHVAVEIPGKPSSYAITEQIRTVSRSRISGHHPIWPRLRSTEIDEIRALLRQMIDF